MTEQLRVEPEAWIRPAPTQDAHGPSTIALHRCENPLGPPADVERRVAAATQDLHLYPAEAGDRSAALVAAAYGVQQHEVLLTRGIDEAVDLLLLEHRGGWGFEPGFDGYAHRARSLELPYRSVPLGSDWAPAVDARSLTGAGVGFIADPNNPTGQRVPKRWLADVMEVSPLVCVDETYLGFADDNRSHVFEAVGDGRLCVFVSFSKLHGLAGLRLGALFGTEALLDRLRDRQRFHSLDVLALAAIDGCLADPLHIGASREHVLAVRPRLAATLRKADHLFDDVRDTETNFVIARAAGDAGVLRARLAERGLLVHDCAANGLPGWLRVSVGTVDEVAAVERILARMPAADAVATA